MTRSSFSALVLTVSTIMMAATGCAGNPERSGGGPAAAPAGAGEEVLAGVSKLTSVQAGPVLFVIAGIHGDETSGVTAARQLAAGPAPARGTIIILPAAAPEALASGERWAPHWSDLNRAFPVPGSDSSVRGDLTDPAYRRADAILGRIAAERPALVLDLHESDRYWTEGGGPALVIPRSSKSTELALALLELPGMEDFAFTGPPPAGSLAAAVDYLLGIPALIVEVPDSLPPEERERLHGVVMNAALCMLGMLGMPCMLGMPSMPSILVPTETP